MSRLGKLSAGVAVFSLAVPAMLAAAPTRRTATSSPNTSARRRSASLKTPASPTRRASTTSWTPSRAARSRPISSPRSKRAPRPRPYTLDYSVRRSWSYMTYVGTIWLTAEA